MKGTRTSVRSNRTPGEDLNESNDQTIENEDESNNEKNIQNDDTEDLPSYNVVCKIHNSD